jgi:enterobactin synthetase component D
MNSFISDEQSTNWFDADASIYHCQFNKEHYKDELFTQLKIQFPSSLINAVTKRRAEFLAGRYSAARALQQLDIHNFNIETGKHRNPVWPFNVKGSISHCDNYAIAIATDRREVMGIGIDIENQISRETLEKTQSQILSDSEIDLILNDRNTKALAFTLAFSLKESFFKAAYPTVEKYFDFHAVSITELNWSEQTISFSLNETLHEKFVSGMSFKGQFHLLPEAKVVTLVIVEQ